ncbi:MAG: helix-turn-helix transcriptional regulator [Spirochaetota bacterium]
MRPRLDRNDTPWLERISPVLSIAGGERCRADWLDPKRVIYDHELMLVGSGGRFLFEFDASRGHADVVELDGPAFVIIPPGRWHSCRGLVCAGIRRAWLHFDWVATPRVAGTPILTYRPASPRDELVRPPPAFVPRGLLHGRIPNETFAFEIHARAAERFNHGTPRMRATSRALLLELLLHLLSDEPAAAAPATGAPARLLTIRHALDDLSQMPFSRADSIRSTLARLGMSYDHQARLFRDAYGITPLQYVSSKRVERAKKLLRDTAEPVAAVAERMGFDDVVYFNRFFRKLAGTTPGAFRRAG